MKHHRVVSYAFAVLLLVGLCAVPAHARAIIGGEVVDRDGNPVEKLRVMVSPYEGTGLRNYSLKTNAKGAFFVAVEQAGKYKIVVQDDNYELDRLTIDVEARTGKPVAKPGEDEPAAAVPDGKMRTIFAWQGKVSPASPAPPVTVQGGDKATVEVVVVDRLTLQKERSEQLLAMVAGALKQGDRGSAKRLVEDMLSNTPEDPLGLTLRAYLRVNDGDNAGAEADLDRALEQQPDLYDARYQLASLYRSTERPVEALQTFRQAAEMADNDGQRAKALLSIGELERDSGNTDAAIEAFEQAIEADPELTTAVAPELADLHTKAGHLDTASEWLEVSGNAASSPALQYNVCVVHFNSKEWEPAADCFRKVLALDPSLADAHKNLATALLNLGFQDESLTHFREYLALRPDAEDAEQIQALVDHLSQ